MTPVDFSSLRPSPLRFDSLRLSPLHSDSLRSVAPGGSHPFQDERATGVSPLLGVGRTRRRDTLVPHVSSDRCDSPQDTVRRDRQMIPFRDRQMIPFRLFHRKQGKANVAHALGVGFVEVLPGALVLDEELAGPEEVDEAPVSAEIFHRLLEGGDGAAAHAKDVEEFIPKGLSLRFLGAFSLPFAGEFGSAVFDLVPGKRHRAETTGTPGKGQSGDGDGEMGR